MSWWEALLLGLVQGLTEFLPVSSSGHLVLGKYVLGVDMEAGSGIVFEVLVHLGTALSIIVVYRKDLLSLIRETIAGLLRPADYAESWKENADFRTAVLIGITLVPTGIVYVLFKDALEALFSDPRAASGMLLVTGVLLLLTRLRKSPDGDVTPVRAFFIGVAQAMAMIPGISRSGSTICTGIYLNVEPARAADFSFLMLLPVVLGASALKMGEFASASTQTSWLPLLLGTAVAFISGIVAIRLVIGFVRRGRLHWFALYCFIVGMTGLLLLPAS